MDVTIAVGRILVLWLACVGAAVGQTTIFQTWTKGLVPPGCSGRPVAGDLDGDGDVDLLTHSASLCLNDGIGKFADASAGRVPRLPNALRAALADVDGDRDLDVLVVEGWAPHAARLLLNDGQARFTDATAGRMPPGSQFPHSIATGDVDADGDSDFVLGVTGQSRLLLNDGRGTFSEATVRLPKIEATTVALALIDVDGDRDLDLVLTNNSRPLLFANDGRGSFTDVSSARLPDVSVYATALAAADVDKDGDFDLLFGAYNAPSLLLLNDGRGRFTAAPEGQLPPDAEPTQDVVLFDADGDGDLDLVTGNSENFRPARDRLYRNDGRGRFQADPRALPPEPGTTVALVAADFDRDGDLDLVAAREQLELFLNDGSGTFRDPTPRPMPRDGVIGQWNVGDLNGDGALDAVVLYSYLTTYLAFYLGDGKGGFARLGGGGIFPTAVALLDVDGDRDLDVYIGRSQRPHFAQDELLLNDGKANFSDATSRLPIEDRDAYWLASGDLDGDGDQDLVVAGASPRLYVNDGRGTFTDATAGRLPAVGLGRLQVGDIDRDGDLDLLGTTTGGLALLVNDGTARFRDESAQRLPPATLDPTMLLPRDADGDGDLDLLFANRAAPSVRLYVNDGRGVFADETGARLPHLAFQWPIARMSDVDLDGALDIVASEDWPPATPSSRLLHNDGRGRFTDRSALWPREALTAAVFADVDADGDEDAIAYGSSHQSQVYFNLTRQLRTPEIARLGRPFALELLARPGYAVDYLAAKPFVSTVELAGGIDVWPYGRLWVDLRVAATLLPVLLPPPAGRARVEWTLPNVPALAGLELHAQALFFDLRQARLSNATTDVVH